LPIEIKVFPVEAEDKNDPPGKLRVDHHHHEHRNNQMAHGDGTLATH